MPIAGVAHAADNAKSPPPIGQMLVREGDYAVKLAQALKVKPATTEADAESALALIGIAPENGWISDFPVTPDIVAEIQSAIDDAAGSGKLAMSKVDAYNAFEALNAEAGLSIAPGTPEAKGYVEVPPSEDQTVINNYYAEEGPPVITYYEPPEDYADLYEWDAFPFWCDGFFFPGFFVLSDFAFDGDFGHRHHHHRHEFGQNWHGHGMISNHVIDPGSKRTVSIDPVSRQPRSATSSGRLVQDRLQAADPQANAPVYLNGADRLAAARRGRSAVQGRSRAADRPAAVTVQSVVVAPVVVAPAGVAAMVAEVAVRQGRRRRRLWWRWRLWRRWPGQVIPFDAIFVIRDNGA